MIHHDTGRLRSFARSLLRVLALLLSLGVVTTAIPATAQTKLSTNDALYARVRKLANGEWLTSVTAFTNGNHIDLYASSDAGITFNRVGSINDSEFSTGLCCGSIFQLTRAVGSLPSGTLLWAGSVGQDVTTNRRMKIKLYRSSDNGRTWTYLSAVTSPNDKGIWEPELSLADDGALVMMYSDETNSATSQKLVKTRTYNGTTWQDLGDMVASTIQSDRPGMAVVSKLNNGTRFMTFELCGPAACTVFYKTSTDGWNWGTASNVGTAIRLSDGRYFEHAPYNTVMPDGSILVVGQMLYNGNGTVATGNGTTIFRSASGNPAGPWTTINAPVGVPGAYDHPCPNYSSPLISVTNGTNVLELAGRLESSHCYIYFARGPAS